MAQIGAFSPQFNGFTMPVRANAPAAAPLPRPEEASESVRMSSARGVCFLTNGETIYLPKPGQSLVVGRDPKSDMVFADKDVSRRHAEFAENGGQQYVRDLGSTFGTFVNGKALEKDKWVAFQPGDSLRLGKSVTMERSQNDLPEQLLDLQLPKNGTQMTVGRSPENSLVTPWTESSRSHAVIEGQGEQIRIYDQGSTNGTFLNGKRIPSKTWVTLSPGNKVQFGNSPLPRSCGGSAKSS